MHRVIRKRIRMVKGDVNVAADIDAVVAINTAGDATSQTVVRSSHTVVQGSAGDRDQPRAQPSDDSGPRKEQS